jgi:hypothetical protein
MGKNQQISQWFILYSDKYDEYWTDRRRILLYNATVLFMVIDNVDSIDSH